MGRAEMVTASFPMYNFPQIRGHIDAFWAGLSSNLRKSGLQNVPDNLSHDCHLCDLWDNPELLISQCCGFDVINRYKGWLKPIATPHYNAPGCVGENYCSRIVVAADCPYHDVRDMAGVVAVINGPESHSGMSALRHLVTNCQVEGRFFSSIKTSGSHAVSLELIRQGKADVAAIDSVTLALLERYQPDAMDGLKVLGNTYAAPAPPYVVKASMPDEDVKKVQNALLETFRDRSLSSCRDNLLLKDITLTKQEDYWLHEAFAEHALKRGFSMLH